MTVVTIHDVNVVVGNVERYSKRTFQYNNHTDYILDVDGWALDYETEAARDSDFTTLDNAIKAE